MNEAELRIVDAVEELDAELIDFLTQSVRRPSLTGREDEVASFYEYWFTTRRWAVRTQSLSGSPLAEGEPRANQRKNVIVSFPGRTRRLLTLNGHMDVVPEGELENWSAPAFSGDVLDGHLYGRGSVDMKGGIAAGVFALAALDKAKIAPAYDVCLQLVIGEETSGVGTRLALENSELPALAMVLEPTGCQVVPVSTGLQFFTVEVDGRAAHTSAPWRGIDAFAKLLAVRERMIELADRRSAGYRHELFAGVPTAIPFAVGRVVAGEYRASIPATASMSGRLGLRPGESPEAVRLQFSDALRELAERDSWFRDHPARITWNNEGLRGWETDRDHPLIQNLIRAQRQIFGEESLTGFTAGSDAAYFGGAGVPTAVFGPGDVALAHAANERVSLDEVRAAAKVLALTIARLP